MAALLALIAVPSVQAAGAGTGNLHLTAVGAATLDVQGKLVAWGTLPTAGRIEVRGRPGTFSVRIGGALQKPNRRGVVRVEDAVGSFAIQGPQGMKIRVEGSGVDISVAGRGALAGLGSGEFSLNGAPKQPWTGQPLTIAPTPRGKRPPPATSTGRTPPGSEDREGSSDAAGEK
jgi:hypothetical protein